MAELPINTTGRKNLIVGEVKDKKKVGEAEVMDFFAKIEGEENSTKYGVWSKAGNPSKLEALVKTGTTIDCDVEVKTSEKKDDDGNHYRSRKVTNIYQDGKAVKEQGGSGWKGKSPETIAMELDGRFRNTALMQACELLQKSINDKGEITVADTIIQALNIADKFYAWLKGEKTTPHKEIVQPAKQEASLPIVATTNTMPANITTGVQLAAFAGKHGIDTAEFIKRVQGNPNNVKTPEQLNAAWAMLFPEALKE